MQYATGGSKGKTGQTLALEVPVAGVPTVARAPAGAKGKQPSGGGGTGGEGAGTGGSSSVAADPAPAGPVVKEDGDDILVDPPVRNLPQWDGRWGHTRIGGPKTGKMLDWQENGCNASTAAMILRWFAEDCPAGKLAFPTKSGGAVDPGWFGPRMGEAFWPQADPPGKVELTEGGSIHFRKLYGICAHYLRTGGEIDASGSRKAHYVDTKPAEGWLPHLRKLLKTGPVIVGLGAPAPHFVLCHGVKGGGLLLVDPGNVLYTAAHGGKGVIQDWSSKGGFADGTKDAGKVRMPKAAQWPGGSAPGEEGDPRAYNHVSGDFLEAIFSNLISLTSLTSPDGARLGAAARAPPAADNKPEPRPGYPLLPEDLKARYLKMSFQVGGQQVDFSLEHLKYHNVGIHPADKKDTLRGVIQALVTELQKSDMALLEELVGPKMAKGVPAFVFWPFQGKGSPEQIQAVLKIVGHFGKTRLRSDWPDRSTLSESLAAFYLANMGLDCNGFAGNYAVAVGARSELGPDVYISRFAPANMRRRKLDEIQPGDVIVWDPHHIATIQGRRSDGHWDIVESNDEPEVKGLGNTVRELKETGGDTFKIRKVPFTTTAPQTVFVATLK